MSDVRVLLIDDEEELVTTLLERLQRRGLSAAAVTDGRAALELMRRERFDVAVIDLKMPGLNGLELKDIIHRDHPGTRVILATGHGRDADGGPTAGEGQPEILLKPFNINTLVDLILADRGERRE